MKKIISKYGQGCAIEAVILDVYGTIVEIREKRNPFQQLLQVGKRQGRPISSQDAVKIMSAPLGLRDAAQLLGIELTEAELARLNSELRTEIASIRLFPDSVQAIRMMQERGIKVGLCSNLAVDYAKPVVALLPFRLSACTWSFEVGAVKPNPLIYASACDALKCPPENVLMVGDSVSADVAGPNAFGMQSTRLDRTKSQCEGGVLSSLFSLRDMLISV